jgi:hypothetical protein
MNDEKSFNTPLPVIDEQTPITEKQNRYAKYFLLTIKLLSVSMRQLSFIDDNKTVI